MGLGAGVAFACREGWLGARRLVPIARASAGSAAVFSSESEYAIRIVRLCCRSWISEPPAVSSESHRVWMHTPNIVGRSCSTAPDAFRRPTNQWEGTERGCGCNIGGLVKSTKNWQKGEVGVIGIQSQAHARYPYCTEISPGSFPSWLLMPRRPISDDTQNMTDRKGHHTSMSHPGWALEYGDGGQAGSAACLPEPNWRISQRYGFILLVPSD